MPYAVNGRISQAPIEGGIEISEAQYAEALTGILAGKIVTVDAGFALEDPPPPEAPEPEAPPATLEAALEKKLEELDDYRWAQEVGGAGLGEHLVRTDANSQAKVAAAYAMARLDPLYSIPTWEMVPGTFVALDNATILAMGEAVRDHVQDTFTRKAQLYAQIIALETLEAVNAFDIAMEWAALG